MTVRGLEKYRDVVVPALFGLFLLIAFCFGGSSRADTGFQIVVRLASIVMLAAALFFATAEDFRRVRAPLLLLGALALLMLIQSIPLPPFIWTALPGRQLFVASADLAGIPQPWRPISLAPDATINSILSTLPGFAALIGISMLPRRHVLPLLLLIVALAVASAVLGVLQISSGEGYLFAITNRGSSVGFFANRNHQAALLALAVPVLGLIAVYPTERLVQFRLPLACALALLLLPMILITGSRAGLLLLAVGIAGAVLLMRSGWKGGGRTLSFWRQALASRFGKVGIIGFGVLIVGVLLSTIALSRALAIQRLFTQDIEGDTRLRLFGTLTRMVETYFPFGSGFGSFPATFKIFEPDWYLGPSYFNHAHNDLLEILIEGGLASLALALIFLTWCVRSALRIWRPDRKVDLAIMLGRLGSIQVLTLVLASIADYPLRTPLSQVLFLLGLGFMALASSQTSVSARRVKRGETGSAARQSE